MAGRGTVQLLTGLLGLLLCLPTALLAQKHKDVENIGERDINEGSWNLYSLEKEISLGRQLAQQVEASSHLFRDPMVHAYVDDLVQRLARNSDAQLPFSVKVIDSDELNAFALPGGFLYVNTGLILEARTEAELAGILAHEIAHVTARHLTKQQTKATLFQWFTLPLVFVGGPVGLGIQQAIGLAVPLTFLKFQRNYEREADFLGLQYTYRAGYDPVALIDILERLKESEQGEESRLAKIFSSHPMTRDRIERAQKSIAEVLPPRAEFVVSTSNFEAVQARLRQLQQANWIFEPGEEGGPSLRRRTQD
ncbi:MAG TPA: M48 family metallopeptidase [Candidatus Acidoferrales bacterium]|nr:M48 family metallopeptidase [Candidatus Acidoferrales bacterium]